MKKNFTSGFTPIEVMVVMAIIGILFTLGGFQYQNVQKREQFKKAQREVISSLNRARSLTRRSSTDQAISWNSGKVTTISVSGQNISLSHGVTLKVIAPSSLSGFSYLAPFGRKSIDETITMLLEDLHGNFAKIYIYGASGKIAITSCEGGVLSTC